MWAQEMLGGYQNFNPLHREGGDLMGLHLLIWVMVISIHSTARVETAGAGGVFH